jgi:hypothetical protein
MNSTKPNSNPFLESALRYARNGRKIFPILDGQKFPPLIKEWGKNASSNPEQIAAWWRRWPNANVGLACMASGISVIDIDKKPDGSGEDTIKALAAQGKILTPTKFSWTPRCGRHLYYRGAIATTTGKLGKYVDTRGTGSTNGGYVLLPPSRTADGVYRADNNNRKVPIAPVDPWVVEMYGDAPEVGVASQVPLTEWDLPVNIERARDYLKTAPVSKQGGGGGDLLVKTIAPRLKDMAISEEMAVEILTEPNGWNSRCEPPWSLGDDVPDADNLAVKVHNGYVYCVQNPPGIDTADADFAGITDDPKDTAAFVLQMRAQEQERQRDRGISYQDFAKFLPEDNTYIFIPTGEKWKAQGVATACPPIPVLDPAKKGMQTEEIEARFGVSDPYLRETVETKDKTTGVVTKEEIVVYESAVKLLSRDRRRQVAGITWWPGQPPIIQDTVVRTKGGIIKQRGTNMFNSYRPPQLPIGKPRDPGAWLDHLKLLYPDDWPHIVRWFAARVQWPERKILHALVMGGGTRIGKDTIIRPLVYAVGPWNVASPKAQTIMDEPKFNPYLESVVCLINEVRDFGDDNRHAFYNRMQPWLGGTATGVLECADKNVKAHPIIDVFDPIITTNLETSGLFLPDDDARHYVAWSNRTWTDWGYPDLDTLDAEYFKPIYDWFVAGGYEAVAYHLRTFDLSDFSPTAPPKKTEAWYRIVRAWAEQNKDALATIIEKLGNRPALTPADVLAADSNMELADWSTPKGRNFIPRQFEGSGYVSQGNPDNDAGRWQVGTKTNRRTMAIYVQAKLSVTEKIRVARERHALEQRRIAEAAATPAKRTKAEADLAEG